MEVLTVTQAAQLLNVSRRTVERLRALYYSSSGREGLGPWLYLGGVRIERAAVERCALRSCRKAVKRG